MLGILPSSHQEACFQYRRDHVRVQHVWASSRFSRFEILDGTPCFDTRPWFDELEINVKLFKKHLLLCQKYLRCQFSVIVGDKSHIYFPFPAGYSHERYPEDQTWKRYSVSWMSQETTIALVAVFFDRVRFRSGNHSNPHLQNGCLRYRKPWIPEARGKGKGKRIPHVQVGHGAQDFWVIPCQKIDQSIAINAVLVLILSTAN